MTCKRALIVPGTVAEPSALSVGAVAASGKVKATPGVYDPDGTGIVVAAWVSGAGEADGQNGNQGLVLQKNGPTTTNAAAGAVIDGVAGAGGDIELGFDVSGYCTAGSPRFDVTTTDGTTHFLGCSYGTHTELDGGWTRVRLSGADAFPALTAGETVQSIEIVADEQGRSVVDDIDVAGTLIGKPGSAG